MHDSEALEGEGFALREYWNVVLKRLWTIILVFVLAVTGVALYTFQQPRIYEASTTVIIEFQPPRVFGTDIDDGTAQPVHWLMQSQYFETQLRVIQSRKIAERVVRDHGLAENLEFLGLSEVNDEEALARALEAVDPAKRLMSMIAVEPIKDTRMVHIKVQHDNPQLAADLSNAVAEAYQEQSLEDRLETMQDAFHWLEAQYKAYDLKVHESNESLRAFKLDNPLLFTNPGEQQLIINNKLNNLNTQLIQTQAERRRTGYTLDEIKQFKVENIASTGMGLLAASSNLTTLTNRYLDLQQQLSEAKLQYVADRPQVKSLEERLKMVEAAIEAEVRSIRRGYQGLYDAARKTEGDLRSEIKDVQADALELDQLKLLYEQVESQREERQRLFELVQRRLNEVNLTRLLQSNNISVLDRATAPTAPVKPRVMFNLLLGAVIGLLAGIGLAFLLEMLDNTIKNQEDIEQRLGMPFLGVIPAIRESDKRGGDRKMLDNEEYRADLHVKFYPKSSVAECARTIRTNILFMSPGAHSKVLLVTSPSPLEGKTTTAVSLATVMAQSNDRVLLLEADMRRPRLHKAFGLKPTIGLATVLIGADELDDTILATGIDNLDMLPCGPIPPNPSELFHTPEFAALLERLKERYDRIIIDSPPVIAVTDAMILAQHVDGVIIVTRTDKTRLDLLKRTRQLMQGINAPLLGTILNHVNLENRRQGTYYYYYYRRHGQYYEEPSNDLVP